MLQYYFPFSLCVFNIVKEIINMNPSTMDTMMQNLEKLKLSSQKSSSSSSSSSSSMKFTSETGQEDLECQRTCEGNDESESCNIQCTVPSSDASKTPTVNTKSTYMGYFLMYITYLRMVLQFPTLKHGFDQILFCIARFMKDQSTQSPALVLKYQYMDIFCCLYHCLVEEGKMMMSNYHIEKCLEELKRKFNLPEPLCKNYIMKFIQSEYQSALSMSEQSFMEFVYNLSEADMIKLSNILWNIPSKKVETTGGQTVCLMNSPIHLYESDIEHGKSLFVPIPVNVTTKVLQAQGLLKLTKEEVVTTESHCHTFSIHPISEKNPEDDEEQEEYGNHEDGLEEEEEEEYNTGDEEDEDDEDDKDDKETESKSRVRLELLD